MILGRALVVLFVVVGLQCRAQQVTATLSGTVSDPSGALVPEAQLTATNINTGVAVKTVSDSAGNYVFPSLPSGTYSLSAEKSGFKSTVISPITLTVYQKATMDVVLQVGSLAQTVEVAGAAPLVSTSSASVGTVVGEQATDDLPLNLRHASSLVLLVPGTIDTSGRSEVSFAGNGSGFNDQSYAGGGGGSASNLVLIDGMLNRALNNGGFSLAPVPEMVKEFNIQNNTYDAAYGIAAGTVMNMVTQSGTNQFHGSTWEYLRNGQKLDARNFFAVNSVNPTTGAEIPGSALPAYIRNQFGFAVGGPIRKDKTFFFGSYEGLRQIQGQSVTGLVPTASQKAGDFSSLLTGQTMNLCGAGGPANLNFDTGQLFEPASEYLANCPSGTTVLAGTPVPGNVITSLDPVSQKVLAMYPAPNRPGIPNYVNQTPFRRQDDQVDMRIDETISEKDQLYVRYMFGNSNQFYPGSFNPFNLYQHFRGSNIVLDWTHTFGPNLLNEFRAGYMRNFLDYDCAGCPRPPGTLAGLGMEGVAASIPQWESYPEMLANNFANWGDWYYNPDILPDGLFKVEDTVTKIRGRHTLVFGGDANFWNTLGVQDPIQVNGNLDYSGQYSSLALEIPNAIANSGLADMELGYPSYGVYTSKGIINELAGGGWFSLFAQDSIRVSPRLSVQVGLRWEYRKLPYDKHNLIATLFPLSDSYAPGDALILTPLPDAQNDALCSRSYFISPEGQCVIMTSAERKQHGLTPGMIRSVSFGDSHGNFAPRLGISWRPTNSEKFIVHAGAGIFYDIPITNEMGSFVNNNPVFTTTALFTGPVGAPPVSTNGVLTTSENVFANAASEPITDLYASYMPSPNYHTPTMDEWSLGIESQLRQNLALEVNYQGNRGNHIDFLHDAGNQPVPGVGPLQPRRVWPDLGFTTIDSFDGISTYNALTAKLTKRFSSGISALVAYTYSKVLDYDGGDADYQSLVQNDNNPRADYGLADFSLPQRLVISGIGMLPFGSGHRFLNTGGVTNGLVGGWEITGIITLQSGYPFTVLSSVDLSNTGSPSPRPDRVCSGAGPKTVAEWFNTSCFNTAALTQAFAAGTPTWGNAGRNILSGPGLQEWDISLIKKTKISERLSLEFRGEFFNLFNRPNFAPPANGAGATYGASEFGAITSQSGTPRDIQFGLKLLF